MTCLTGLKLRANPNCLTYALRVEAQGITPVGTDVALVELFECRNEQFSLQFGKKLCPGNYVITWSNGTDSYPGTARWQNNQWEILIPFSLDLTLDNFVYSEKFTVNVEIFITLVKNKNCWEAAYFLKARDRVNLDIPEYGEDIDVIAHVSQYGNLTLRKSCC